MNRLVSLIAVCVLASSSCTSKQAPTSNESQSNAAPTVATTSAKITAPAIDYARNVEAAPVIEQMTGITTGLGDKVCRPDYPPEALKKRIGGGVNVLLEFDTFGTVTSATAISGPVPLRSSAVEAALCSRFLPRAQGGVAACVKGTMLFWFWPEKGIARRA